MKVHLTEKSTNRKTGPIPVSTTSEDSCPKSCPWFGNGCYANGGPLRIHWKKVSSGLRGTDWSMFIKKIQSLPEGQFWRHNQAGDLPGKNERINGRLLSQLVHSSKGRRGFTYTHKQVEDNSATANTNRRLIKEANSESFTINLSANGLDHADSLQSLGIAPVTTVLSSEYEKPDSVRSFLSPAGNKIVVCPAAIHEKISCTTCRLCAISTRKSIIGFPAHGSSKKKLDTALETQAENNSD